VDTSNDRLREIPQWPWRRRTVRWVHQARRSVSWKLQRPDRPRSDIYSGLQELLAENMGGTGELNTNDLNRWTHMIRCGANLPASTWERLSRLRKRAVGYNGPGRQNRQTIGHIPPVSSMAGSHRTQMSASTPTSAANPPMRHVVLFMTLMTRNGYFEPRTTS